MVPLHVLLCMHITPATCLSSLRWADKHRDNAYVRYRRGAAKFTYTLWHFVQGCSNKRSVFKRLYYCQFGCLLSQCTSQRFSVVWLRTCALGKVLIAKYYRDASILLINLDTDAKSKPFRKNHRYWDYLEIANYYESFY